MDETKFNISTIIRWILTGLLAGATGAATVALFTRALQLTEVQVQAVPPHLKFLLPVAGAVAVGWSAIRFIPEAGGEGTQSYIGYVNSENDSLGIAATLIKFPATVVTLGSHCSGGIVGPLSRIGAGLSSYLTEKILNPLIGGGDRYYGIGAICGVSGIISSIFHSPLGGAIFAVEIIREDTMEYRHLFPSLISGITALFISRDLLHQQPAFSIPAPPGIIKPLDIPTVIIAALITGALGFIFTALYRWSLLIFRRIRKSQPISAILGGAVTGIFILAGLDMISGTSMTLFNSLAGGSFFILTPVIKGGWNTALFISILIFAKILATSSTIGSGLSAGLTGPLIIIGIMGGAALSSLMHIPPGGSSYYVLLAAAIAAMLGGAMNIPLAAILITTRMMGFSYLIPALFGSILSFLIYKPQTVFDYLLPSTSSNTVKAKPQDGTR